MSWKCPNCGRDEEHSGDSCSRCGAPLPHFLTEEDRQEYLRRVAARARSYDANRVLIAQVFVMPSAVIAGEAEARRVEQTLTSRLEQEADLAKGVTEFRDAAILRFTDLSEGISHEWLEKGLKLSIVSTEISNNDKERERLANVLEAMQIIFERVFMKLPPMIRAHAKEQFLVEVDKCIKEIEQLD